MLIKRKKNKVEAGFTLIELMVVIVIMTIVYAISMGSYVNMGRKVDLENTAYSVALTIRETQYYGINKKLKGTDFSDEDPYPFGFHLNKDDLTHMVVFRDFEDTVSGARNYGFDGDCKTGKECQQLVNLPSKVKIKSVAL